MNRNSPAGMRPRRAARAARACAVVVLACVAGAAAAEEVQLGSTAPGQPIPAVWKPRSFNFTYSSATSLFSCESLAGRVATIVRAVGARDDVRVQAIHCSEAYVPLPQRTGEGVMGYDPSPTDRFRTATASQRQVTNVSIRAQVPTEVTPEILAELEKDKSRRELVSRVTGDPVARFDDPIPFSAERRELTLSKKTIGLIPEECELVEQMAMTVLRQMGARILRSPTRCTPGSRLPPELRVEVLVPSMHVLPGEKKKKEPEPADDPPPS